MASLKTTLLKDTAIYGLSSIVGRFLNYLLVPLYSYYMPRESGEYGQTTNIYAWVALVMVILTFGMETTMFRFANKDGEQPDTVFSTAFATIAALTGVFLVALFGFLDPISQALRYDHHPDYLAIMAVVVALDALQALPFAFLRLQKRAVKFASLKLLFIVFNIALNVLFFVVLRRTEAYYVFVVNLCCTAFITFFFIPDLWRVRWHFDMGLLRRMLSYSWPLLILGVAGILNQTFDKIAFPLIYPHADKEVQLGIYGACVKIAMIMAMITQAFRYAYEPLVFSLSRDKESKQTYAVGMRFFLSFTLLAFLCVVGYMDVLQLIIGPGYREGLRVVPIVMVAEIMMGVYFNLSFWYKLIDRTIWGAWFSLAGCTMLVAVNVLFVPQYGYMACAWGGVAGYGTAMLLSYVVGQKKNPMPYAMRPMTISVILTAVVFLLMMALPTTWPMAARLAVNTLLIAAFAGFIYWQDVKRKV